MLTDHADLIGLVAAALTTGSFSPQVVRTWRRGGEGLSYAMLGIFLAGVLTWLVYGLALGSMPVIVSNVLMAAQLLALVILKRTRAERAEAR
jgi:MtN3 and saliva related transmembrane protein